MTEGGMLHQISVEVRKLGPRSEKPAALYDPDLGEEEAAVLIKNWVLENYEDPRPRYGRLGFPDVFDPYDLMDLVEVSFLSVVGPRKTERAIAELRKAGISGLVPHIDRLRRAGVVKDADLHGEMLRRISELEARLQLVEQAPPERGHNRPPEPIDDSPFTSGDRQDLIAALDVLKAQPVNPADGGAAAKEATGVIGAKGQLLVAVLAGMGAVADGTSLWQAYGRSIATAIENLVLAATAWIAALPPM